MTKRKPTNDRIARGISTSVPKAASWRAFDALPPTVRRVLWEAPVSINPLSVQSLLEAYAEPDVLSALGDAIRGELMAFAAEHQQRHGHALPHVAAEVTLQGYGR